jgi:ribonuclease P/MRP protein subunit RPP1
VAGSGAAIVLVQAGENGLNRSILTTKGVHILCGVHAAPKNAFDRFCARLAAEQRIAVDIRIAPLISLRGLQRQKVIRAYEEIGKLQQRYEFPLTISSGARSITDIRSPLAITHLLVSTGFDQDMVADAMKTLPGLINRGGGVREVRDDAETLDEG